MKFLKDFKKYLIKEDIFYITLLSFLVTGFLSTLVFQFFLAVPTILFAITSIAVNFLFWSKFGMLMSKKEFKLFYQYLFELGTLLEKKSILEGTENIKVERIFQTDGSIRYNFCSSRRDTLLFDMIYYPKINAFSSIDRLRFITRFDQEKILDTINLLSKMIESEETASPRIGNDVKVEEYSDEITEGLHTLENLCVELLKDDEYLSIEETHLIRTTIPKELLQMKKIYLSFTIETKVSQKEEMIQNMKDIKNAIDSLRQKVENQKIDSLSKVKFRIQEKISKRI